MKTELIKRILEEKPQTRNSDVELLIEVWRIELYKAKVDPQEMEKLFDTLRTGQLTLPETVSRQRRKLQEQFLELRDKKYIREHRTHSQIDLF